jgi:hypothetical protein
MQMPNVFKKFSMLEMTLTIIFIIYLVLPIETPHFLVGIVDSPLGMLTLLAVTVYLFFYSNPVLAIIYIFVAYEMLRRTTMRTGSQTVIQYTPSQAKKDSEMRAMNPPKKDTLEEEVVDKMAPVGRSDPSFYTASSFKPVADKVGNASMY